MKKSKYVISIISTLFIVLLGGAAYYVYYALPIGTGYTAKYLCSSIFLIGRGEKETFEQDIKPGNFLFSLVSSVVDHKNKTVTSKGLGLLQEKTAVYRPGFGCTLVIGTDIPLLKKQVEGLPAGFSNSSSALWPKGDKVNSENLPSGVDSVKLKRAVDFAFTEPENGRLQSRGVVIVYKGRIIAERYDKGITPMTPLLGWSMAKTVTGLLTGMMVKDGLIDINKPAPVKSWRKSGDPRGAITIDHIMQMSSGLGFKEIYGPFADATNMLYDSNSMAGYAEQKPLESAPGTIWYYSSGTTNILMRILYDKAGGTPASMHKFLMNRLYRPLGLSTAVFEPDASGVPVGSSYLYASARDWARLGLFMLNDGIVDEKKLLPEGWVSYMTTTAPGAGGIYGAQTWLNAGYPSKSMPEDRLFKKLPKKMYYMGGHNHQNVFVFPEHDLVVVRLGVTHKAEYWDKEKFLVMVMESIGAAK